jgi:benzoyl-CoA 2,3-dioxygenase component B
VTIDLFGADVSSNAATFYSSGLKGRYEEAKYDDDHLLRDAKYPVLQIIDGCLMQGEAPALNALNERLRDDYIADSVAGVGRWNRIIHKAGIRFELIVPHKAFNRRIGPLAGLRIAPDGRVVAESEWKTKEREWLATDEDRAFVASLMGRVASPGAYANWISPPTRAINKQPDNFEFVRFN